MSYWGVILTQPQQEPRAVLNLKRQGFEVYAPQLAEPLSKTREKVVYLFPRYVFARIESQWRSILGTWGVSDIVRSGMSPTPLPDQELEAIRAMESPDGLIRLNKSDLIINPFKDGDRVRIESGPFRGHIGLYAGMTAKEREGVLLEFLGSQRRVPVDRASLAPWEEKEKALAG